MTNSKITGSSGGNVALYPWFKFFQNLIFWQAVWFLYFQNTLSAVDAILLYAIYDIATTALEVPSGYMSDRLGRRKTLIAAAITGLAGSLFFVVGSSFPAFVAGQLLIGASTAFASGTDSAMLYESLSAEGREAEVEEQELKAWRYSFIALAVSAVTGGALYLSAETLPFLAATLAYLITLIIAYRFREPPRNAAGIDEGEALLHIGSLKEPFTNPVLIWIFAISVLMYIFSHLPFVFGQPFILEALQGSGFEADAPLVSGLVSAMMMAVSVGTSLMALWLRRWLGLGAILLFAFAIQIGLSGVLALTNDAIAIAVLFLRMVPNSLSRPFILARIQPLLSDESRATYMSLQSFAGRLILAGALYLASFSSSSEGVMSYPEIQQILGWFVVVGLVCLGVMALASRRVPVEPLAPHKADAIEETPAD